MKRSKSSRYRILRSLRKGPLPNEFNLVGGRGDLSNLFRIPIGVGNSFIYHIEFQCVFRVRIYYEEFCMNIGDVLYPPPL